MDLLIKSFNSFGAGVEQEPRNGVKDGIAAKVSLSFVDSDVNVSEIAGLESFVEFCPIAAEVCLEPQAVNKMAKAEISKGTQTLFFILMRHSPTLLDRWMVVLLFKTRIKISQN